MKNFILITPFLALVVILIFLQHHLVASQSRIQQKIALFKFKQSLNITTPTYCTFEEIPSYPKTKNWSMSSDHCTWEGVTCDHETGDVIGLDLSCSQLEGAILPNSTLFQLSHLRFLNLSNNNFYLSNQFPQEFGSLAKGLTHLNLSYTGRVPSGISHLCKLISLDLSHNSDAVKLENEAFKSILQNLTQLRVLNLDGVNISSVLPVNLSTSLRVLNLMDTGLHGVLPQEVFHLPNIEVLALGGSITNLDEESGLQAVLPKVKWGSSGTLQHLLLSEIDIYGGIPDSIGFLNSLATLELDSCNLSGPIPKSLGNLGQLTYLGLQSNSLNGPIPTFVANLTNLRSLILSHNNFTGTFPYSFVAHSSELIEIHLTYNGFTGPLSPGLFNHTSLEVLDLSYNGLTGPLPPVLFNHTSLQSLGLRYNGLTGPLPPWLFNLPSLEELDLNHNGLTGPLPPGLFNHTSLQSLGLRNNGLTGPLPPWLFNHTSLESLDLGDNGFTGQLYEFDSSMSQLNSFDCSYNLLHGPISQSISQLVNLNDLDFSSNNFNGILYIEIFSGLENLDSLDLSYNSLSVRSTSVATLPPMLTELRLSSCNMKEFPHFSRDAEISLDIVDLSNNEIEGEIPHWIGSVYIYLNISHNSLTGGLEQLPWNNIQYLDLQSNKLNGSLPTLICNSSSLEILNLSNNTLSGVLPNCRTELSSLIVLDLRMNGIQGSLPSTLSNFRNLETLNLNGNKLEGRIPSSFAEFDYLQVLDLGNNQINDTFPQCLEPLPNLQVLVLKSNKFHGFINKSSKVEHPFPSLRIIDLSYNDFSGPLPAIYFRNFKAMMDGNVNKIELDYMSHSGIYSDSTVLVIKDVEIVLERILTVYTTIDISKNKFVGGIPEYIGNLVSLRFLNISHNYLAGHIPSSVGNLSLLESLDLSSNQLEGEIPQDLTRIYTLELLNLSHNQLSGRIPQGSQFNTFDNDSYGGNLGLCGNPLSKECENGNVMQTQDEDGDGDSFFGGFTWEAVVIGYGCGVVPAFIIGNLMLLFGKPKWFVGIIARELGLKIRRMEIKWR